MARSKKIRSDRVVKRVDSLLGALEDLGRLCAYRSQPARNVGAKGSEGVDDGVILLIRVVLLDIITDFTTEAGSQLAAHANIDVGRVKLVLWQARLNIILVDFDITLSGQQGLETTRARQASRRGALRRCNTRSTTRRGRLHNSLSTRLAGRRVPKSLSKMVMSPLGPLNQNTRVLHVNYDLGTLGLTGETIALEKLPSAALAVQLETVPAIADNLNLAWLKRTGSSNIASLDMDTRNKAVGRDLVVGRVGGSTHNKSLAVFRQFNGGDGSERGSLGSACGPLGRGTRQDTRARRGNGSRILEVSTRTSCARA